MIELLQDWPAGQAALRPEAAAVVMNGEEMSYGRLEGFSNRLARMLQEMGCRRQEPVCLLMPKSAAAIAAIVGILKAGCVYVPLDPAGPAKRLAKIFGVCENRWVLAAGSGGGILSELSRGKVSPWPAAVGWMDEDRPPEGVDAAFTLRDLSAQPEAPPERAGAAEDAAYIMFTSGSTGTPKGVVITHANVIAFIEWAVRHFRMRALERISGHPPLHFDLSVFDIFGAFAAGAELHLTPRELNLLPNKLAEFIRRSELTQWFSVPGVLHHMAKFDVVRFGDFPKLKRLLWCGEVFPVSSLRYWMERLPHATFTNLYGPTETTIASSFYTVPERPPEGTRAIPIGSPCEGETLLVLDENLRPAPAGQTGRLYIGGAGLSPGYYRDAGRTREAFVSGPEAAGGGRLYDTGDLAKVGEDGLVYFLGRADSQIKSRGHRIELGEIASALDALSCLRESAVVAVGNDGWGSATICCAYAARPGCEATPAGLRSELSKALPAYMLPARWLALAELPRNANGKIDIPRLKERFQSMAGAEPAGEEGGAGA